MDAHDWGKRKLFRLAGPLALLTSTLVFALACPRDGSRSEEPRAEAEAPNATQVRPNLLLITVDTLRPEPLACYGGDVGEHICSIARGGTRYDWAFSPAPSTAPAVASILTSLYPSLHGVTQFVLSYLPDAAQTVAESLHEAGYATGAVIANPVLGPTRFLHQGFDVYDARMNRNELNRYGAEERDAVDATNAALAWLEDAREPWFLWVHYQDPHGPYSAPGAPAVRDAPDAERLPVLADHSGRSGIPAYQAIPELFSLASYEERYRQEIRFLDGEIARLLAAARTVPRPLGVLLTADHGEAFGEDDYWFAHGHSVQLEQVHVPLLWQPPGAERGAALTVSAPVSTIDVAPTLLAAAGVPAPESFQGVPLARTQAGATAAKPRLLYTEHRMRAGVVAGPVYYTRDRGELREPIPDRITGGQLEPMAPRTRRLFDGADGAAPPTRGETIVAVELDALLDAYLETANRHGEPEASEVPDALREQLESLGYLE